jgi:oxygen-independent coproporphyrinogen-3 oxidase
LRPHVLAELGRTHGPDNVARAVWWARDAGIERVNLDLIYGTPGETVADWEATLDAALALDPGHVSAYALTVEAGTPLGRAVAAGTRRAPDDDDQATKYEVADDRLTAAGRPWYEVSNWARPGEECRHNLLYWEGGDYAAVGCAAHGHRAGRRFWNVRTPERYVAAVTAGPPPEAGSATLDPDPRRAEATVLALPNCGWIKLRRPRPILSQWSAARRTRDAGLLGTAGDRRPGSRRGRLLGNEVGRSPLGLAIAGSRWHSVESSANGARRAERRRSSGQSWRSTSPPRSRWGRRPSRAPTSACRAPRSATT